MPCRTLVTDAFASVTISRNHLRALGALSDNENEIIYKTDFSESYWGTIIEDDYHGVNLNKKERTKIEKDIIIRFTKEDLSYTLDPETGQRLFQ